MLVLYHVYIMIAKTWNQKFRTCSLTKCHACDNFTSKMSIIENIACDNRMSKLNMACMGVFACERTLFLARPISLLTHYFEKILHIGTGFANSGSLPLCSSYRYYVILSVFGGVLIIIVLENAKLSGWEIFFIVNLHDRALVNTCFTTKHLCYHKMSPMF